MKRPITILVLLCFLLGLSACKSSAVPETTITAPAISTTVTESVTDPVHTHNFSKATCTDPALCDCGETKGQALGHAWEPATCIAPKTCSVCGETEGKVASHNYMAANCSAPKTCKDCGKTTGKAASHSYADGVCVDCGKTASVSKATVWIPTKGGTKYHSKSSCSNMIDPEKVTKSEAEALGFAPCKRCYG